MKKKYSKKESKKRVAFLERELSIADARVKELRSDACAGYKIKNFQLVKTAQRLREEKADALAGWAEMTKAFSAMSGEHESLMADLSAAYCAIGSLTMRVVTLSE